MGPTNLSDLSQSSPSVADDLRRVKRAAARLGEVVSCYSLKPVGRRLEERLIAGILNAALPPAPLGLFFFDADVCGCEQVY